VSALNFVHCHIAANKGFWVNGHAPNYQTPQQRAMLLTLMDLAKQHYATHEGAIDGKRVLADEYELTCVEVQATNDTDTRARAHGGGVMDWHKARRAIEKGLSPQINDYNAVSAKQFAMYQAVSQLDRVQSYGSRCDSTRDHMGINGLPLEWERT
jgi:hypothetical protein